MHEHEHSVVGKTAFGQPGMPAEADREIEVSALDSLRFDPDAVDVQEGETIRFVIANDGRLDHEFVLGDEAYQRSHSAEMAGGMMHEDEANAVSLAPGETKSIAWKFTGTTEVLFGCHVDDHYDAGMVGVIEVG